MSEKLKVSGETRRGFLKLAGLAATSGAAVAAAGGTAEAAEALPEDAAGYRETDHVKTYYELARF